MTTHMARTIIAALVLFSNAICGAQLITHDGATFQINSFDDYDSTWGVDLTATGDQLYAIEFLYRLDGQPGATPIEPPDSVGTSGNVMTMTWSDVGNAGLLDATMEFTVFGYGGGTSATLLIEVTLANRQASARVVDFYPLFDLGVNGGSGGDSGTLLNANDRVLVTEGPRSLEVFGDGADGFVFNDINLGIESMIRTTVYDAPNATLPFGPAEAILAFQWADEPLPASGSARFVIGLGVDRTAAPVEVSEFSVD